MKHNTHFSNNGRVTQSNTIYSTQIKSKNNKKFNVGNGKLFTKELTLALQEDITKKSNQNKNEETNLTSWIMNILNPINHIPIISTINKMANKKSKPLDIAQAAIGGAIYGGGPIGLAKGIGTWFFNKLVPQIKVASNSQITKDLSPSNVTLKKSKKSIQNISNTKISFEPSKIESLNSKENISKLSTSSKLLNNNFFYYHYIEQNQKKNVIDTDA